MIIKVLGGGCANCKKLKENTKKALDELNLDATILEVTDYQKILEYGVMRTPALVVDEKVVLSGRVASSNEIKRFLQ
ncbi:thioredoxin family protein [Caldicellulosiruptoraceae bacterium PP1]